MGKTSIEWTDHSWPVVNGCRRVSPGCENCYAERLTATRLKNRPKYAGLAVWKEPPSKVLRKDGEDGRVNLRKLQGPGRPRWTGETRLWVPDLGMPLRLKKPARIFVADMGDLFYEKVTNEEIAAVFGVMAACPQHTFQVLTKRPERARQWFAEMGDGIHARSRVENLSYLLLPDNVTLALDRLQLTGPRPWPLPNVWLGVSAEDQATADERIPHLLATPAAVRFVSAEPLLGPVDLERWMWPTHWHWAAGYQTPEEAIAAGAFAERKPQALVSAHARFVDWVIVGGESGPGARPFDLTWARQLVQDCAASATACFVKQIGAVPVSSNPDDRIGYPSKMWQSGLAQRLAIRLQDRKGGDPDEWPADLRVRQFPDLTTYRQTASSPSAAEGKQEACPGAAVKTEEITAG